MRKWELNIKKNVVAVVAVVVVVVVVVVAAAASRGDIKSIGLCHKKP
jgi:hypothetical protein